MFGDAKPGPSGIQSYEMLCYNISYELRMGLGEDRREWAQEHITVRRASPSWYF